MLEVRENEIALRKLPGGAAQLRTLDVTLLLRQFRLSHRSIALESMKTS